MIRRFVALIREKRARRRLAEIVANTRASYECRRYAEKRTASKKGWATRRERIAARSDETPLGGSAVGKSRAEGLAQ